MAELDFSRVRLSSGFEPRTITIPPSGAAVDKYGHGTFELETARLRPGSALGSTQSPGTSNE